MPKRIEWIECDQCEEEPGACPVCDGLGMMPVVSYQPAVLNEVNPWKEVKE